MLSIQMGNSNSEILNEIEFKFDIDRLLFECLNVGVTDGDLWVLYMLLMDFCVFGQVCGWTCVFLCVAKIKLIEKKREKIPNEHFAFFRTEFFSHLFFFFFFFWNLLYENEKEKITGKKQNSIILYKLGMIMALFKCIYCTACVYIIQK